MLAYVTVSHAAHHKRHTIMYTSQADSLLRNVQVTVTHLSSCIECSLFVFGRTILPIVVTVPHFANRLQKRCFHLVLATTFWPSFCMHMERIHRHTDRVRRMYPAFSQAFAHIDNCLCSMLLYYTFPPPFVFVFRALASSFHSFDFCEIILYRLESIEYSLWLRFVEARYVQKLEHCWRTFSICCLKKNDGCDASAYLARLLRAALIIRNIKDSHRIRSPHTQYPHSKMENVKIPKSVPPYSVQF